MPLDVTVSQTALVVIAIAVSIQSVLLVAAALVLVRASTAARAQIDRRLDVIEARVEVVSDAARRMADTVELCTSQVSGIIHQGERITAAVAAAMTTPKAWLVAGAASRLFAGWRRRHQRIA